MTTLSPRGRRPGEDGHQRTDGEVTPGETAEGAWREGHTSSLPPLSPQEHSGRFKGEPFASSPTLGFSTLPWPPPRPQPHQHPTPLSILLPRTQERGRDLRCLPPSASASSPTCSQPLSPKPHHPPRMLREHGTPTAESPSVTSDSLRPHGLYSPRNSPGQNAAVHSLSLLQGVSPTQGQSQVPRIAGRFFTG